ncbi:MAG: DUF2231 domain-containing protein [Myxococcales bacterium]|nr:DUF2231 domain-containing protein [Myxococcales bacterium]
MSGELHPFVLHFAVGLLLTAPLCDVVGLILRREPLLFAGRWMTLAGTFAAVLSAITGFGAEAGLGPHSAAGEALLNLHRALGIVMVLVWVPIAVWRGLSKLPLPLKARTIYLALAFSGAVILTVETALGGALVFRHGVGLSPAARAEPVAPAVSRVPRR